MWVPVHAGGAAETPDERPADAAAATTECVHLASPNWNDGGDARGVEQN